MIAHVPNWKRFQRSSATSNCARRTCGGGRNEIVAGDVSCRLIVVHVCIRVRQRSPTDNQHIHAQADPGHEPIKKDWPDHAIRTSSCSSPETPAAHNPASCFIVSAFHIATSFETSPFARVSIALPGARATPSRRFAIYGSNMICFMGVSSQPSICVPAVYFSRHPCSGKLVKEVAVISLQDV